MTSRGTPHYAFVLCLLLAGCGEPLKERPREDWQDAPKTHVCSEAQMVKVQTEAKWCNDNTTYFATFCYGSAIMRNCSARSL